MKMKKIDIGEIRDFRLGNAENRVKGTGCTVILCETGAVGGVDVRGGGPATRETDLIRSENSVNAINAVVLSGGSAFGLEAASGVMRALSEKRIGFRVGDIAVPIVCGASLFDLEVGDHNAFPDVEMGIEAVRNAYKGDFKNGNHGAGTGATVGKILGQKRSMKTGLGTFACADDRLQVGAVVAVNSLGDIYNSSGEIIAGLRTEDGSAIFGTIRACKNMIYSGTRQSAVERTDRTERRALSAGYGSRKSESIAKAIEAEYIRKTKAEIAEIEKRLEASGRDHFQKEERREPEKAAVVSGSGNEWFRTTEYPAAAAQTMVQERPLGRVRRRAELYETEAGSGETPLYDTEAASSAAPVFYEEEPDTDAFSTEDDDRFGYDIPFNTTIGCLITNAKLTKSQANKLASILHDAYARAIRPVHCTLDGDTVFVLASGSHEVNFDAFAALATDVMQYAIIDGALSARNAYGLPAAADLKQAERK